MLVTPESDRHAPDRLAALVAQAQEALSREWSHPVQLRLHETIRVWGRHTLLRCQVNDRPVSAPDFVVVKAANETGGDMRAERAGLELIASIAALENLVPALFGANSDNTLLVIEDVGGGPTLSRLLRSKESWAREALVDSMVGLAAVHAGTRGAHDRYEALRAQLGATSAPPGSAGTSGRFPTGFPQLCATLSAACRALGRDDADLPVDELREVSVRMQPPALLRCLTFYDQCPPNRLMADGRLRFVDLEMVGFEHPFLDGAYPLIGHFNCMDCLRLPPSLAAAMLDAYRTTLAAAYPELTADDQFGAEMTSACAVWLVSLLRTLPDALARDRVVGFYLAKNRQRLLAVLDAFIEAASAFGQMPRLTQLCRHIHELVTARWADTVEPLPHFPIFTTAQDR